VSKSVANVIEAALNNARRAANDDRLRGLSQSIPALCYEIGIMRGVEFAAPSIGSVDADNLLSFESARNELNFLFGRYQERT
jgi:hypothetical protein